MVDTHNVLISIPISPNYVITFMNKYQSMQKGVGLILIFCCFLQGCIKHTPANPEADVEMFVVDSSLTTNATVIDQSNRKIQLFLTSDAYDKGVAPVLTLSKNATVTPASGDSIHPKEGIVQYTVTSETGENKKTYTVEIINVGDWNFEFENWQQNPDDKYEFPVEGSDVEIWSSGNTGVALAGVDKTPDSYPLRSTTDGYQGTKGAELITIKGTFLSDFVGIHLFAGSLYTGDFNSENALAEPLAATEFGEPYIGLPNNFTGYYKYTPGAVFQDENENPVAGKTDQCSIYAVLFKGPERLNGTNINTSDRVIATAKLADGSAKADFTKFDIPFTYKTSWDSTTTNLMMAIVVSSSGEGDHYRGAIGSKLVVDDLTIIPK